jgi:hypothetical protein
VKPTHRSPARIAIIVATLSLLFSMLACGGIIPSCNDVECALSDAGCLICQGAPTR